jgi:hypothetical protein
MRVGDNGTSSRRDLLSLGVAIGVMGLLGRPEATYGGYTRVGGDPGKANG